EPFDEFAQGRAEREFDKASVTDVAGELKRLRSERPSDAISRIGLAAVLEDPWRRGEAQHVIHDRRLAEQADNRGQRRLRAYLAALSLQAFQERRFLAADVGAG